MNRNSSFCETILRCEKETVHIMGAICEDVNDTHNVVEGANVSSCDKDCDDDDDSMRVDLGVDRECSGHSDIGEDDVGERGIQDILGGKRGKDLTPRPQGPKALYIAI